LHDIEPSFRLQRADEDQAIALTAFDEQVEEPVHAVVEINVGRAGRLLFTNSRALGREAVWHAGSPSTA
jgi:hypothetical protein